MRMYLPLTSPAYGESDCLIFEIKYRQNTYGNASQNCYQLEVMPGGVTSNSFFCEYCKEYYDHFGTMVAPLVYISRRSKKREEEAIAMVLANLAQYAETYRTNVFNRGGGWLDWPELRLMTKEEVLALRGATANA